MTEQEKPNKHLAWARTAIKKNAGTQTDKVSAGGLLVSQLRETEFWPSHEILAAVEILKGQDPVDLETVYYAQEQQALVLLDEIVEQGGDLSKPLPLFNPNRIQQALELSSHSRVASYARRLSNLNAHQASLQVSPEHYKLAGSLIRLKAIRAQSRLELRAHEYSRLSQLNLKELSQEKVQMTLRASLGAAYPPTETLVEEIWASDLLDEPVHVPAPSMSGAGAGERSNNSWGTLLIIVVISAIIGFVGRGSKRDRPVRSNPTAVPSNSPRFEKGVLNKTFEEMRQEVEERRKAIATPTPNWPHHNDIHIPDTLKPKGYQQPKIAPQSSQPKSYQPNTSPRPSLRLPSRHRSPELRLP